MKTIWWLVVVGCTLLILVSCAEPTTYIINETEWSNYWVFDIIKQNQTDRESGQVINVYWDINIQMGGDIMVCWIVRPTTYGFDLLVRWQV